MYRTEVAKHPNVIAWRHRRSANSEQYRIDLKQKIQIMQGMQAIFHYGGYSHRSGMILGQRIHFLQHGLNTHNRVKQRHFWRE